MWPDSTPEPGRPAETAQTLDRGLWLLHHVADAPGGLTAHRDRAERLGVGRTVVYRLAATLTEHAMIRRDPTGRLRLGAGILHLAGRAQPLIADAARPVLRRLAESVGATAHLTVADASDAVALAVVEPSWTALHVAYRTGTRHPLDRGAARPGHHRGPRQPPRYARLDEASSGELQSGAHGIATAILGIEGLEASVGVIALSPLDPQIAGPRCWPPPPGHRGGAALTSAHGRVIRSTSSASSSCSSVSSPALDVARAR